MKVIVGMSGGVDSSVTAYLLQQQGFTVAGLFMKNWEDEDSAAYCSATEDEADARTVCDRLKIPLYTVNFAKTYWEQVFEYFLAEHRANRTPNPDVLCNQEIKFDAFLRYALDLGADYMATGHYAFTYKQDNVYFLNKASDLSKDQSYFLCRLNQYQLQHSLFPLGKYSKSRIREIAKAQGFINHNKKDSTGICFIGKRNFKEFLAQYITPKPGLIKTEVGEILGEHDGLMFYTIGQRQGLKIGGRRYKDEKPWYVAAKDSTTNTLIVVQGHEHPLLLRTELICNQIHWITPPVPTLPLTCCAKIRYRQLDQVCTIYPDDTGEQLRIKFTHPQWAITPGQSIVFYQGEQCLGSGNIEE